MDFMQLADAISTGLEAFYRQKLAPRIGGIEKHLETRPPMHYIGVWDSTLSYQTGDAVSRDGIWIARRPIAIGEKPGEGPTGWVLSLRAGRNGKDGKDAAMPMHEWDGSKLRFEEQPGVWGEWVDLRGLRGRSGPPGAPAGPAPQTGQYFPGGWLV